jgi:hypothetical protein
MVLTCSMLFDVKYAEASLHVVKRLKFERHTRCRSFAALSFGSEIMLALVAVDSLPCTSIGCISLLECLGRLTEAESLPAAARDLRGMLCWILQSTGIRYRLLCKNIFKLNQLINYQLRIKKNHELINLSGLRDLFFFVIRLTELIN